VPFAIVRNACLPAIVTAARVRRATDRNDWHLSNHVLYDLCASYPRHTDKEEVLTKILLVGRRKQSKVGKMASDDFLRERLRRRLMLHEDAEGL